MRKLLLACCFGLVFTIGNGQWQPNGVHTYFNTGNVGIGLTSPNFALSINSVEDQTLLGGNTKSVVRIMNGYASGFGRRAELQFGLGQYSNEILGVIAGEYSSWNGNIGGDLVFGTTPTSSTSVFERMRINRDGNVGIGTTAPNNRLEIFGSTFNRVSAIVNADVQTGFQALRTGTNATNWELYVPAGSTDFRFYNANIGDILVFKNDGKISTYGAPHVGTFNVGTPSITNSMTLGSSTGVGFSNTISGLYGLYMGVSGTGNTWIQGGRSDGQAIAYDISLQASGGNVGIGIVQPQAKLDVFSSGTLGSSQGNFLLLNRFSSSAGTANLFMNNNWLLRDGAGSNWLTARLHNGLSIDGSYLTPGVDTRTWWERDPYNNIQSWGDASQAYLTINQGNVGIGTTSPDARLAVKGIIHAEEVKVDLLVPGPDYVFEPNYKLLSLEEIKSYIDQHKHLPEVPSAKEMETNGVNVSEMNMLLLKKIEELTLHIINQNEFIQKQNERITKLEEKQGN